jgi:hypothetical protein
VGEEEKEKEERKEGRKGEDSIVLVFGGVVEEGLRWLRGR